MSLYAQTITLVCCYLTAVALAVGFFFSSHIGGWEAILRSPIGDRADQVASAIHNQLLTTNREKWTEITKNFGQLYNVKYYIFDFGKKQLAGETIELPQQVANIVSPFPPPPHGKMGIFRGESCRSFYFGRPASCCRCISYRRDIFNDKARLSYSCRRTASDVISHTAA